MKSWTDSFLLLVNINEAANGVYLPNKKALTADFDEAIYGPRHETLHTANYLGEVADRLESADLIGGTADDIREELQSIAFDLINGDIVP